MYNVEVTKTDDNSWAPKAEYLWPNEATLHINAYSPYSSTETLNSSEKALNNSEGITSLPSADETGNLSISWVTPSDVANQQDLLWAVPKDASASPCDLTFNHALTAIRFVTGSEMIPCTIKKIEITNVLSSGSLNIETGEWTPNDAIESYSVTPNIALEAVAGEAYVAAGTAITSDAETFLLLPQTLTGNSEIILTIESNGTESNFNASLENQIWTAGKTVIYRLSANPVSDSLILDILDANGNPVTELKSHYTGDTIRYSVSSHYTTTTGGQSNSKNIPWKAEFIDDDGNIIERPQWITAFSTEGNGDIACKAPTVLQEPVFAAMSDETRKLRDAADINSTSGYTPYNLSNSTGAPTVENTANCYVVSAPGKYSLPLVYGNAIKEGAANTSAYKWDTHTRNVLKTFINHLGNDITDPYIYNNSGCEPKDAYMVWEGRLCLIGKVALSEDKHSLLFEVPATYIRQGNALLAVRDKDGNIMWSWQIWVTPNQPEEGMRAFSYNGNDYHIMARNIGEISGGDDTYFEAQATKVRFTQITDDNLTPKSVIIDIKRDDKHVYTPFCYTFYQWGRKDPILSRFDRYREWYDADHNEITEIRSEAWSLSTLDNSYITKSILNPDVFWTASHNDTTPYNNLWNIQSNNHNGVKSVYDPSPLGFKMPGEMLKAFALDSKEYDYTYVDTNVDFPGFSFTLPDGDLYFALLGYRAGTTAGENGVLTNGSIWSNILNNSRNEARCFQILAGNNINTQFTTDPLLHAFGVRPIKDE